MENSWLCRLSHDGSGLLDWRGNVNPYRVHQMICKMYPRAPRKENGEPGIRILYRDFGWVDGGLQIMLLAPEKPESPDGGDLRARRIPAGWLEHGGYLFDVEVNAQKWGVPQWHPDRRRGKCFPILDAREIMEWFMKRAPGWGFSCPDVCVDGFRMEEIRERGIILNKAVVRGTLRVEDREAFRKSALRGIGRGRAFGCGFLQLAPID